MKEGKKKKNKHQWSKDIKEKQIKSKRDGHLQEQQPIK